jgi:hypothetical protein
VTIELKHGHQIFRERIWETTWPLNIVLLGEDLVKVL